ncbi:MAG: ABC-F family ATP-binding cassette domain-containing protein [Clostridiales bacterium]|nr:ABC-F family ATP-binding cassette domain-containing protein [Clostridiales bacterium]
MNIITANDLRMVYGADEVFRGVSFFAEPGERIGIVGANGAGKTTLLKLIAGELEPSGGGLSINQELKIGYLKQSREGAPEDGSGGERAKRALEEILSGRPDILLLDEPTNHLDFDKLAWLESRIRHFKGTILMVSHDRYFLDRTVSRIFDMGDGALKAYNGNYSAFREKKAALLEAAERAYKKDLAEYKRQADMIRHMKERGTEKLAKRAASREKKLMREQRPEAVHSHDSEGRRMNIRFSESRKSGNDVLLAEGLGKSFGERRLFEGVDFDIKRGETVCMVGANGVGKTTLFRILSEKLAADEGWLERGHGVRVGYYDQHQENLKGDRTLLEEMQEAFPTSDDTMHRKLLGAFLFSGDKAFQRIETLSGGEKARLSLLKLIRSGANTLLLDEPTNHLDIASMEVVEDALREFPGTLLIISHDRYLLETLPDRIMELTPSGLENYHGKFDYYFEKRAARASESQALAAPPDAYENYKPETDAARERRLAKEAETDLRRRERQLAETEQAIDEAETKIASLETDLADPANSTDHELLAELHGELTKTEEKLALLFIKWESIM